MKIAIVGTAGLPASYGGFETLAENLVIAAERAPQCGFGFTVFCSGKAKGVYHGATLVGVPLSANGWQSILYDAVSLWKSRKFDLVLLLGVSGAIALPFFKVVSKAKIVTNIDGVEWRREKWNFFVAGFLRLSQEIAVRVSDSIVVDNDGVLSFLKDTTKCVQIEYGGDHALVEPTLPVENWTAFPDRFFLSICRIEPENNVHVILKAFASADIPLVFVGNWDASTYGRDLRTEYGHVRCLTLHDPIYDLGVLSYLRGTTIGYVHGHSAGGTNPSLVEAMHFGKPIVAYDCIFNRATTEGVAIYFSSSSELASIASEISRGVVESGGEELARLARRRFTWDAISKQYFSLFSRLLKGAPRDRRVAN